MSQCKMLQLPMLQCKTAQQESVISQSNTTLFTEIEEERILEENASTRQWEYGVVLDNHLSCEENKKESAEELAEIEKTSLSCGT